MLFGAEDDEDSTAELLGGKPGAQAKPSECCPPAKYEAISQQTADRTTQQHPPPHQPERTHAAEKESGSLDDEDSTQQLSLSLHLPRPFTQSKPSAGFE